MAMDSGLGLFGISMGSNAEKITEHWQRWLKPLVNVLHKGFDVFLEKSL